MIGHQLSVISVLLAVFAPGARASDLDEFKVKRQGPFEFTVKPTISRAGDRVAIRFKAKAFCDVTVAVENANGETIRHLASGVLGRNAPAPLKKDSLAQELVWDGKNDQGEYVEEADACTVRVSLGLMARYERPLFWEPKKRVAPKAPLFAGAPEGMYVYEARAVDHLRLFDHEGNYVRTVYPFPASKLRKVKGLVWREFPELGEKQPLRRGSRDSTLLSSGQNGELGETDTSDEYKSADSQAASAMAVQQDRIALAMYSLNRLATDGSSGGLDISGPAVELVREHRRYGRVVGTDRWTPTDAAFSPDGATLYLTGYHVFRTAGNQAWFRWLEYRHGVMNMNFAGDAKPVPFRGEMNKSGTDHDHFHVPTSVACDAKGNVYVADYLNDRVQVFRPDGSFLKTIAAPKPTTVRVDPKTGRIYVFSWLLHEAETMRRKLGAKALLRVFGPLARPTLRATYPLPGVGSGRFKSGRKMYMGTDRRYSAGVDFATDPPTVWLGYGLTQGDWGRGEYGGGGRAGVVAQAGVWARSATRLAVPKGDKLAVVRNFGVDAAKSVPRLKPPRQYAQHLFVNPATGKLYVLEYMGLQIDGLDELLEIDPGAGDIRKVKLPFQFEDVAFGAGGLAYFQTEDIVIRWNLAHGREVPWDYGEERKLNNGFLVIAGLPVRPFGGWHHWAGKIDVSVEGTLAANGRAGNIAEHRRKGDKVTKDAAWTPQIFPGRGVGGYIRLWDRHGKLLHGDALPGLAGGWAIGSMAIDKDNDIYVYYNAHHRAKGEDHFLGKTGVVIKATPGKALVLNSSGTVPVPLPKAERPKRRPEIRDGWVQGAQWLMGGVGFNTRRHHCQCWHTSIDLDCFGRLFVPQPSIYRVTVVDTNGNVILRVGQYGNADDGVPLVPHPTLRHPRPIGGDEVALVTPNYVATDTDRRLFIADAGNGRILSAELGYHATERIALKDVPEGE